MKLKWTQQMDNRWELAVSSKQMEGFSVYGDSKEKCLIEALKAVEAEVGELSNLWTDAEEKLDAIYRIAG